MGNAKSGVKKKQLSIPLTPKSRWVYFLVINLIAAFPLYGIIQNQIYGAIFGLLWIYLVLLLGILLFKDVKFDNDNLYVRGLKGEESIPLEKIINVRKSIYSARFLIIEMKYGGRRIFVLTNAKFRFIKPAFMKVSWNTIDDLEELIKEKKKKEN